MQQWEVVRLLVSGILLLISWTILVQSFFQILLEEGVEVHNLLGVLFTHDGRRGGVGRDVEEAGLIFKTVQFLPATRESRRMDPPRLFGRPLDPRTPPPQHQPHGFIQHHSHSILSTPHTPHLTTPTQHSHSSPGDDNWPQSTSPALRPRNNTHPPLSSLPPASPWDFDQFAPSSQANNAEQALDHVHQKMNLLDLSSTRLRFESADQGREGGGRGSEWVELGGLGGAGRGETDPEWGNSTSTRNRYHTTGTMDLSYLNSGNSLLGDSQETMLKYPDSRKSSLSVASTGRTLFSPTPTGPWDDVNPFEDSFATQGAFQHQSQFFYGASSQSSMFAQTQQRLRQNSLDSFPRAQQHQMLQQHETLAPQESWYDRSNQQQQLQLAQAHARYSFPPPLPPPAQQHTIKSHASLPHLKQLASKQGLRVAAQEYKPLVQESSFSTCQSYFTVSSPVRTLSISPPPAMKTLPAPTRQSATFSSPIGGFKSLPIQKTFEPVPFVPQKSPVFVSPTAGSTATLAAMQPARGSSSASESSVTTPDQVERMILERGLNPDPSRFDLRPANARFFVIKSFREDHVFKSIKHGVWSSTEIGNKRLHQAYLLSLPPATPSPTDFHAQQSRPPRLRQNSAPPAPNTFTKQPPAPVNHRTGPIILFFSVNGSGHFCGVAQMTSSVDWSNPQASRVFTKDGKWEGIFSVKWVYVKDVANQALRHLKVFTNENKPVTNSRDTQEIPTEIGYEMLRIYGEAERKTCLLDDWNWYQRREEEGK
ncbi:hypothetical protein HDU98_000649 [Podochytrium sp. JEL0797]|nr:hypothetical protein HDU98_000649 [Podochytrium sp. JEL0797]